MRGWWATDALQVRYEQHADILLAFLYLAYALICLNSLNQPEGMKYPPPAYLTTLPDILDRLGLQEITPMWPALNAFHRCSASAGSTREARYAG